MSNVGRSPRVTNTEIAKVSKKRSNRVYTNVEKRCKNVIAKVSKKRSNRVYTLWYEST